MPAIQYETAISQLVDVPSNGTHPFITTAKFVFADDRPNNNNQAVSFDDFESIAQSTIGMPVKINFTGFGASNHPGSSPIGHIKSMEIVTSTDGTYHQLIAEASLWNLEYPEIIAYLKDAWANGDAPGISWELKYRDSIVKDGIEWLRGVIASAATFVKYPAYGPRTSLLALASIKDPNGDEMARNLIALADQFKSTPIVEPKTEPKAEGGNRMTDEEIKQLQADLATNKAEAATKADEIKKLLGDIAIKDGEISTLNDEVTSLQKAALIDDRVRKYTDVVGTLPAEASEADKVKNLFASFTDEQFDYHLAELASMKKALTPAPNVAEAALKAAQAAARNSGLPVPRIDLSGNTTHDSLRAGLRALARPNSAE